MISTGSSVRVGQGMRRRCPLRTMVAALPLLTALPLLSAPATARAQSASIPVSITIGPVLYLSASGSFTFGAATDADYGNGFMASTAGPTLTHRGNTPYKITIAAQTGSTLQFTNYPGRTDADPARPVSDLQLRADATGSYVALGAAGSPADFVSRATRGGTQTTAVDAHLALSYTADPPGTYSTTVVFTIVPQ